MSKAKKSHLIGRDAKTGEFITVQEARQRPKTTTVERMPKPGYGDTHESPSSKTIVFSGSDLKEDRTSSHHYSIRAKPIVTSARQADAQESDPNAALTDDSLLERIVFSLDNDSWQSFQQILDRPAARRPRLAKLLASKK